MSGPHDLSYQYLFAHPEMVRELLHCLAGLEWMAQLDASDFERVRALPAD